MHSRPIATRGYLVLALSVALAALAVVSLVFEGVPTSVNTVDGVAALARSATAGLAPGIAIDLSRVAFPGPDALMSSLYLVVTVGSLGHLIREVDPNVPSTSEDLF